MRRKALLASILGCLSLLGACQTVSGLIPSRGGCVAYGGTLKMSLPDHKITEGVGCIEQAPYPGQQMPPVGLTMPPKNATMQHMEQVFDESPNGEFHEWHPMNSFAWVWTWHQLDGRRQMHT